MKILHCKLTDKHNTSSDIEGPYRTLEFSETISPGQLANMTEEIMNALQIVHSSRYIQKVKGACKSKNNLAEVDLTPSSYEAMVASVGLALIATKEGGFAVCRPPGHHASKEKAEGFCFFNNVAVSIVPLLSAGKKVCIIDIDGHHGNGTESIFKHEKNVMFCSIHQEGEYPGSGSVTYIGEEESYRQVLNIPIPIGSGDDILIDVLEFLRPYISRFSPDNIAVSAGFDGFKNDKLLKLNYSKRGYFEAGRIITSFGKPVHAVLEGGYHDDLPRCVSSFVAGIDGGTQVQDEVATVSTTDNHQRVSVILRKLMISLS